MMLKRSAIAAVCVGLATTAVAQSSDALIARSASDFTGTKAKVIEAAKARGFVVVAEVDHAAGAAGAGLPLPPTHLVIFGNPRGGTPIMACNPAAGIDLPLKALVWQTADGVVNVMVNAPSLLSRRHGLGDCAAPALANMAKAMEGLLADATK